MHLRALASLVVLVATACFSESDVDGGAEDGQGSSSSSPASESSESDDSSSDVDAADTSDASGVDDDGSTSGASVCGDGSRDDGEACDDADEDDLDGCTQACAFGPLGFTLSTVAPPPAVGDGTVSLDLPCADAVSPRPLVLGGLSGHRGGVSVENAWTVSVGGACSQTTLIEQDEVPALALADDPITLPEQGNTIGQIDTWSVTCPVGATPIGIDGRIYSGALPYIASIRLQCATPRLVERDGAFGVVLEPSAWTATGTTHAEQSSTCPAGSVAVGFRGAIDADATAIYALGPLCATIGVVMGE